MGERNDMARRGDRVANYLAMLGHLCSDINQGALSAILPFLVLDSGYSYFQATMLVFCANVASAIVQPLFGWLGDRRPRPWLMALGVLLAGLGMAGIGFAASYGLVLASALVSGVGVAIFHPEGGRIANLAAGEGKSEGMSIFAVGGNIGFFVGPLICSAAVGTLGMRGTFVFAIPAMACSAVLLLENRRLMALGSAKDEAAASDEPERWGMFWLVMGVLSIRSILSYGFMAFVPLMLTDVLGQSEALGSSAISLFAIVGAVATASSGKVSGRTGTIPLMLGCLAACSVLSSALVRTTSVSLVLLVTAALAVTVDLFYPSSVALGMGYVPQHLGMASGLTYGVAVAIGGAVDPVLGATGDALGLSVVMGILGVLAFAGLCLTAVLGRREAGQRG